MTTQDQITHYIEGLSKSKSVEIQELHQFIQKIKPDGKLWFLDGKNEEGKVVTNPNIGYGSLMIKYANGTTKEFYQVGISANTTGISVYLMGIDDKTYLSTTFKDKLGKATITGYCIKFKSLKDINLEELKKVIQFGFEVQ